MGPPDLVTELLLDPIVEGRYLGEVRAGGGVVLEQVPVAP
jgi:hypothetical protein